MNVAPSTTPQQRLTSDRVSVVVPAYNEEATLESAIPAFACFLDSIASDWEILIVNDGSRDRTRKIADELAAANGRVRAIHHRVNGGLGAAFRTGIAASTGRYVAVLDADQSYSVDHLAALLQRMMDTDADVVVASPYAKGGRLTQVPWSRALLSRCANLFLAWLARLDVTTLTGMVRMYRGSFIRALPTRAQGAAVMAEVLYKSRMLNGRIVEVPAHLDWSAQNQLAGRRQSSMRLFSNTLATILMGFGFRPFLFFVLPGLLLLGFAGFVNFWTVRHFFEALVLPEVASRPDAVSFAVGVAYARYPYTFIVGLGSLMVAIQLIGMGLLSLQAKRNFEDLYHLLGHRTAMVDVYDEGVGATTARAIDSQH